MAVAEAELTGGRLGERIASRVAEREMLTGLTTT